MDVFVSFIERICVLLPLLLRVLPLCFCLCALSLSPARARRRRSGRRRKGEKLPLFALRKCVRFIQSSNNLSLKRVLSARGKCFTCAEHAANDFNLPGTAARAPERDGAR